MSDMRSFKPVTPSTRGLVLVNRSMLSKVDPVKSLTKGKSSTGGRNNVGRMTTRNRGGGHKRCIRCIDYRRSKEGRAVVETIEHDPNRNCWISAVRYEDGEVLYILSPAGVMIGSFVESGERVDIVDGNCMPLGNIPLGIVVHNVEMKPGKGGQIARAAGSSATVVAKDGKYVLLRMRSGEVRYILATCRSTIGVVSNAAHKNQMLGKAGRNRWLGRKSRVRGVAMNPVDHPLGGGEGKTSGGRHPVSRSGQSSKGKKTRKVHRYSDSLIKSRRK